MTYAPILQPGRFSLVRFMPAALILSLALTTGCTRPAVPPPAEEYPDSYSSGVVLRVRDGDLERLEASTQTSGEGLPASIAPAAAALTALDARSAVIAVNRKGLVRVRVDPESRKYRIESLDSGSEFPGRSVGALFRRESRVYCLLYRDFVFEREPPRDPPALLLTLDTGVSLSQSGNFDLNLDADTGSLFALFPLPEGRWALQFRKDVTEGVESAFRLFDPDTGEFLPLDRAGFESALSPRPLSLAPEPLRRAALLLAPAEHPAVLSAALEDGSRAVYCFGDGRPEDTVELRGAVTSAGAAVTAWNAVAAVANGEGESAFRLPEPVPGAVYRDIVPLEGAVLALWDAGMFPNLADSGAVLLPAP